MYSACAQFDLWIPFFYLLLDGGFHIWLCSAHVMYLARGEKWLCMRAFAFFVNASSFPSQCQHFSSTQRFRRVRTVADERRRAKQSRKICAQLRRQQQNVAGPKKPPRQCHFSRNPICEHSTHVYNICTQTNVSSSAATTSISNQGRKITLAHAHSHSRSASIRHRRDGIHVYGNPRDSACMYNSHSSATLPFCSRVE